MLKAHCSDYGQQQLRRLEDVCGVTSAAKTSLDDSNVNLRLSQFSLSLSQVCGFSWAGPAEQGAEDEVSRAAATFFSEGCTTTC